MGIRNGNFHVVGMAALKVSATLKCLVSLHTRLALLTPFLGIFTRMLCRDVVTSREIQDDVMRKLEKEGEEWMR
jgi:hypothetical protein